MQITCSGTTGPYRRVYSKEGFSYLSARVHLPGGEEVHENDLAVLDAHGCVQQTGDTGYVYVGGWGQHGGAVDAGFQHSPAHDNWSLFINCEGFGCTYDPESRFAAGQDVWLEFSLPEDNILIITASGKDVNGEDVRRTVQVNAATFPQTNANVHADRAGHPTGFGWNANGAGVTLKRMTSIGQTFQHLQTGSFIKNVRWYDVQVGTRRENCQMWAAEHTQGYHSWQDGEVVRVQFISPAEETASIQLGSTLGGDELILPNTTA